MSATPPKPTPICQCGCQKQDDERLRKLEAKVHRHASALEQALAEIRQLVRRDEQEERRAA